MADDVFDADMVLRAIMDGDRDRYSPPISGPISASDLVAAMIQQRIDDSRADGMPSSSDRRWSTRRDDRGWVFRQKGDYSRRVIVEMGHDRPVVRAQCHSGCSIRLRLPVLSDNRDRDAVIAALTAFGAIPGVDGMNR